MIENGKDMIYHKDILVELWMDEERSNKVDSFTAGVFTMTLLVPKDKFTLVDPTILDEPDCTIHTSYIREGVDYFVFHIKDKKIYCRGIPIISEGIVLNDNEKYLIDSFIGVFIQDKKI